MIVHFIKWTYDTGDTALQTVLYDESGDYARKEFREACRSMTRSIVAVELWEREGLCHWTRLDRKENIHA